MNSSLPRNSLVLLALLCAVAVGAADKGKDKDRFGERAQKLIKLSEREAMAVFSIETPFALYALQFERVDGAVLRIEGVAGGRDVVFVRGEPGVWSLQRVEFGKGQSAIVREPDGPIGFEIVAGQLAYGGDIELQPGQPQMSVRAGGLTWDGLESDVTDAHLDRALIDAAPFVFTGRAAEAARALGQPDAPMPLVARIDLLPPRLGKDAQVLIDRIAAKYGIVLPTPGTTKKDALKQLEKIGAADARMFWSGARWGMLLLDGVWGVEGHGLAISLEFAEDKLSSGRLRALGRHGTWTMPPADVLDDVEGWLDDR